VNKAWIFVQALFIFSDLLIKQTGLVEEARLSMNGKISMTVGSSGDSTKSWKIFLFFFIGLLTFNSLTLTDPPYWDGLVGVYRQGLWLHHNDFDFVGLSNAILVVDGGPNTFIWSVSSVLLACLWTVVQGKTFFILLHLANLGLAAGTLTLMFGMLRPMMPRRETLCFVALAATDPIFSGQCATIYLEIPLAFVFVVTLKFAVDGRYTWATLVCFLSYLMKATGLIIGLALFVWLIVVILHRRVILKDHWLDRKSALLCLLPLPIMFMLETFQPINTRFSGEFNLSLTRMLIEYPHQFGIFLSSLLLFSLSLTKSTRKKILESPKLFKMLSFCAIFSWGFWLSFFLHHHPLVRYLVVTTAPLIVLVAVLVFLKRFGRRFALLVVIPLIVTNLANQWGHLLPPIAGRDSRDGFRLERSREFLNDLQQNKEVCRELEEKYFNKRIVAKYPFLQMLTMPEMGYVSKPLPNVYSTGLPLHNSLSRRATNEVSSGRRTIFIHASNIFELASQPDLSPRQEDKILILKKFRGGFVTVYQRLP
jgi:hypothetical protein